MRSLFISLSENVLMPLRLLDFEVRETVDLRVFTLDVPSGAVKRTSEFEDLPEVDGKHSEAIVFEAVSHLFFFGLNNNFVLADHEHVHVQPFAALRELRNSWVVWFRARNEFPAIIEPDLLSLVSELAVNVFHNEARSEHHKSAVDVRGSSFLLDMERVDNETMW